MQLICLGCSNKETAAQLGCSIKTVEKHRNAIHHKWNIDCTVALVRVALRSGLFPIDDFLNSCIGEEIKHKQPE